MSEMLDMILEDTETRMNSTIDVFSEDLKGMRGNRASTSLVDRLIVNYYGQDTELRKLANISTPEPMTITIRPYDPQAVSAIETAIQAANIGVNPNTDAGVVRLNMPPLTRERRQQLAKLLRDRTEEARVSIRNIRRDANNEIKSLEKDGDISEDMSHRAQDNVQEMTDKAIKTIDTLSKEKEDDILDV